jgi:hypothetical protein
MLLHSLHFPVGPSEHSLPPACPFQTDFPDIKDIHHLLKFHKLYAVLFLFPSFAKLLNEKFVLDHRRFAMILSFNRVVNTIHSTFSFNHTAIHLCTGQVTS